MITHLLNFYSLPGTSKYPPKTPPNLRKYEPILTRSSGKPWYGCAAAYRGVSMFGRPKDQSTRRRKTWVVNSN